MERDNESKKGGDEMAVTKVTARIDSDEKEMQSLPDDRYEANLTAPVISGDYGIEIQAYDDSGNIGIANAENNPDLEVEVTKWHTPKTNWTVNDRFNYVDYNRIKNNLAYLHEEAYKLWKPFGIEDMGEDIFDNVTAWKVRYFNAWEKNLEVINDTILTQDYGLSQRFFENGVFIQWNELNRIESAILSMRDILDRQKASLRKLSFRLGAFKEVKV